MEILQYTLLSLLYNKADVGVLENMGNSFLWEDENDDISPSCQEEYVYISHISGRK
jgi:hypothetical protein